MQDYKKILVVTSAPGYLENKFKNYCKTKSIEVDIFNVSKGNFTKYGVQEPNWNYVLNSQANVIVFFQLYRYLKDSKNVIKQLKKNNKKVFHNGLLENGYVINKTKDLQKLIGCGIKVPKTLFESKLGNYTFAKLSQELKVPFVVKINNMSKGKGVYKIRSESEFNNFFASINKFQKKPTLIYQELVDYTHDLRVLSVGNSNFCMERIPKKGEFRANFSLGGSVQPFKINQEQVKLTLNAKSCGNLRVSGVDILIDKNGDNYILEINHNPGFAGMEKALNVNISPYFLKTILS